jgi:hypothetical protein
VVHHCRSYKLNRFQKSQNAASRHRLTAKSHINGLGSTLARLEATVGFVDHIKPATAANNAVQAMTLGQRLD